MGIMKIDADTRNLKNILHSGNELNMDGKLNSLCISIHYSFVNNNMDTGDARAYRSIHWRAFNSLKKYICHEELSKKLFSKFPQHEFWAFVSKPFFYILKNRIS